MIDRLKKSPLYDFVEHKGIKWPVHADRPIQHPLPLNDQGYYSVDCLTDLTSLDTQSMAKALLKVNNVAIDAFFQAIRRRINILERPIVTAHGEGKSYMYANYNPKYAQYAVTILRTWYNFCLQIKTKDEKLTPAQRLKITNKKYEIEDIIYFK